jgi:hypothetical protein
MFLINAQRGLDWLLMQVEGGRYRSRFCIAPTLHFKLEPANQKSQIKNLKSFDVRYEF